MITYILRDLRVWMTSYASWTDGVISWEELSSYVPLSTSQTYLVAVFAFYVLQGRFNVSNNRS